MSYTIVPRFSEHSSHSAFPYLIQFFYNTKATEYMETGKHPIAWPCDLPDLMDKIVKQISDTLGDPNRTTGVGWRANRRPFLYVEFNNKNDALLAMLQFKGAVI